ncbi:multiple epidermal growth factor-like domains protein 6 [Elgaria multicarinata webbii]|uniref:multiple epidermal growth factor-like domains protein 6 n=1 Tax=Elgaria multicarinata webbii TaxID=159646 RepID=UPI002FCD273A
MAELWSHFILFSALACFSSGTASLSSSHEDMDCKSRCLINCSEGHYYASGNCLECPVGFFCSGGQMAPQWCPVGTYNQHTAQAEITSCQACPDGYISLESRAGCRACPDGYSCDPQRGLQRHCLPGQYSPEGEMECQECPKGYVCPNGQERWHCLGGQEPNPSSTFCVTCFPGFFSTEGTSECQLCPAGHFRADGLMTAPCPAGSFESRERFARPSDGSSSYFPGAKQCLKCPAGYFCPNGTSYPNPCPSGTYNPLQGQDESTDCRTCPAGRVCTQAGLAMPDSDCMPGYVCPFGSSSPHAPSNACPPGTFSNHSDLFDKSQCETCPERFVCTRGSGGKQKPPAPCPAGHYCPPGTKHPMQYSCAPGTWSNRTGLASEKDCVLCPSGWFCMAGAQAPSGSCSAGHFCPEGTQTSTQFPCPAGSYSNRLGNDNIDDCIACPSGAYCPEGTAKPALCPPGTYCSEQGAKSTGDCIPCPGGYHCPDMGTITPHICGAGNFSEPGSMSCSPCLVGHYCSDMNTSREAMVHMMVCPAGMLCPEGLAAAPNVSGHACPRGYYCPQGDVHSRARPCPNGTYGGQRGLGRAEQCLLCPMGKYCFREGREPQGISQPTGDCPTGYACPPGTGSPFSFPCLPGSYWDNSTMDGGDTCKPCPAGFYCDSVAMTQPKICPLVSCWQRKECWVIVIRQMGPSTKSCFVESLGVICKMVSFCKSK